MVHDIDLLLHFAQLQKTEITDVKAFGITVHKKAFNQGLGDIAHVQAKLQNGVLVSLTANRAGGLSQRTVRVTEKMRTVTADLLHNQVTVLTRKSIRCTNASLLHEPVPPAAPLLDEMKSFIRAIQKNEKPSVNEWDGLQAMELIAAIQSQISYN